MLQTILDSIVGMELGLDLCIQQSFSWTTIYVDHKIVI